MPRDRRTRKFRSSSVSWAGCCPTFVETITPKNLDFHLIHLGVLIEIASSLLRMNLIIFALHSAVQAPYPMPEVIDIDSMSVDATSDISCLKARKDSKSLYEASGRTVWPLISDSARELEVGSLKTAEFGM